MHEAQFFITPVIVKKIIKTTAILSLFVTLFERLFLKLFGIDCALLIGISQDFFTNHFFWQPITSLFYIANTSGLFGFLLDLAFNLMLFLAFASALVRDIGRKQFLILFFGSGLFGALFGLFSLLLLQEHTLIPLFYTTVMSVCIAWSMRGLKSQGIVLFFFPVPTKWLFLLALLLPTLSSIFSERYSACSSYLGAFLFTYFYGLTVLDLRSPFDLLFTFETQIKRVYFYIYRAWEWQIAPFFRKVKEHRAQKEEKFVENFLDTVKKEEKPSFMARWKMQWISFKRRH